MLPFNSFAFIVSNFFYYYIGNTGVIMKVLIESAFFVHKNLVKCFTWTVFDIYFNILCHYTRGTVYGMRKGAIVLNM